MREGRRAGRAERDGRGDAKVAREGGTGVADKPAGARPRGAAGLSRAQPMGGVPRE